MRRYALRDDQWERIKDFLPGREGHVGGTAANNRLFVEAVLYRYRADALGNSVTLSLAPGQASDLVQAEPLLDQVEPEAFLADKAYDANALIDTWEERGIT